MHWTWRCAATPTLKLPQLNVLRCIFRQLFLYNLLIKTIWKPHACIFRLWRRIAPISSAQTFFIFKRTHFWTIFQAAWKSTRAICDFFHMAQSIRAVGFKTFFQPRFPRAHYWHYAHIDSHRLDRQPRARNWCVAQRTQSPIWAVDCAIWSICPNFLIPNARMFFIAKRKQVLQKRIILLWWRIFRG